MKKILVCLTSLLLLVGCSNSASSDLSVQKTSQTDVDIQETDIASSAVVYFSATNNTKTVADEIAQILDCDIYEIEPSIAYTEDDLNYNNEQCRANIEQNDATARPSIANDLSSLVNYDKIYLGYPIWWGTNPRIIQTFFETYDLSDKQIYVFCTSGGSGIDRSISDLQESYPSLNIVDGRRFSSSDDASIIQEWINQSGSE